MLRPSLQARVAVREGERRKWGLSELLGLGMSVGLAGALGLMMYLATTSLPYFAESPTTDARFGPLNHCLMGAGLGPRLGFAVSPGARRAAAFGGERLAVCAADPSSRRARLLQSRVLPGIQAAAYDGGDALWLYTRAPPGLYRQGPDEAEPVKLAELPLMGLVGHANGALVVEHPNRILSVSRGGDVRGQTELPAPLSDEARLSVNADGSLAALVTAGGVVVLRTRDASLLRAEAPCDAEALWWLEDADTLRVACRGEVPWALLWNVRSGEQALAQRPTSPEATWGFGLGGYVEPCEGLPCTAPAL